MPRVKRQLTRKHQRWLNKWAAGYYHRQSKCYRLSLSKVRHGWLFAVKGRREGRRNSKKLWNFRIGAASAEHDISYSRFVGALQRDNIWVNRKMLADLALNEPYSFREFANHAKVCCAIYRIPPTHYFIPKNF